jgi:hypothetical protein
MSSTSHLPWPVHVTVSQFIPPVVLPSAALVELAPLSLPVPTVADVPVPPVSLAVISGGALVFDGVPQAAIAAIAAPIQGECFSPSRMSCLRALVVASRRTLAPPPFQHTRPCGKHRNASDPSRDAIRPRSIVAGEDGAAIGDNRGGDRDFR